MKLIDADELIKVIEHSRNDNTHSDSQIRRNHDNEHLHFMKLVYDQPIAFDKKKVRHELEKSSKLYRLSEKDCEFAIPQNIAIEIIEKGGIE